MKRTLLLFLVLFIVIGLSAREWRPSAWPVLKHYDAAHLFQIALPIGGIGTGTVSLSGRGELCDWEIMNIPGKHYSTVTPGVNAPFFAIHVQSAGAAPTTTLLAGPLYPQEYDHYEGRPVNQHGFPRFSTATFDAAYPFGQVHLSDSGLPVKVTVKGFNPMIPGDAEASGLPVAVLSYEVTNETPQPMEVSVCGSLRNFIGKDGSKYRIDWKGDYIPLGARKNQNRFREAPSFSGLYFYSDSVDRNDPAWGTIALVTEAAAGVTHRTSSTPDDWNNAMLNFWDDFSDDGALTEQPSSGEDDPMASLSVKKTIAPHATECFTFYLTWSFPNRKAWSRTVVGNYYCKAFPDAWTAAEKILPQIPQLEQKTLGFVGALLGSSYPEVVKEAALFNSSALRSQTAFRIADGHLMGWEGVMDRFGSCEGSCTHVWNYEVATPFLYGALARTMRDVEFNYATKANGLMNFRAALPLSEASKASSPAADGQMGCIMKFYREWQLSGDPSFLKDNWPQVKKVLSFAWISKGWDGNQDGVMEGEQSNTMDVSYYGPNPQMQFWYLGALRAAEEMSKAMRDKPFEKKCHDLYVSGRRWTDANLFNGEYYEQKITDPETFAFLDLSDPKVKIPDYQLWKGCLVDQLVGQYMAHICGLGDLAAPEHLKTTMQSVMKYNYVADFSRHFNNMRSYVMGDESGLLMASWPKGRLKVPFPYFAETMTGFEYSAAVEMAYEGMESDALKCVTSIRNRFDGAKRSPFDEPECGRHYARSMASWALLLAWSDFHYSAVEKTMNFTSRPGRYFWSNGYAYGVCEVGGTEVSLTLLGGHLDLDRLTLTGKKSPVAKKIALKEGESVRFKL